MRRSRFFVPTLREAPAEAGNQSYALLVRAGFVRQVGAGVYEFLPMGLRVLRKIEHIVRREMDHAGALEILMPALLPAEYLQESGRWDLFGPTLLRLQDRKKGWFHLAPTHEEIVTDLARRELHSYRDVPKVFYQIQTKFRDEPRARGGLLRCREFLMKDAYSFDTTEDAAQETYTRMRAVYERIFASLGLVFRVVEADSGAMGGSKSAEFQLLADSGEDTLVACSSCDYAANVEVAESRVQTSVSHANQPCAPPRKVAMPASCDTLEKEAAFLQLPIEKLLKSLLYTGMQGGKPCGSVLVVMRGDHQVNAVKLARLLGVEEVVLASEQEVLHAAGPPGSVGPIGFSGRIVVDTSAASVRHGACGANEPGMHWVDVSYGEHFAGEHADLRLVQPGDPCPRCEGGVLRIHKGIEGGHIFLLGTHYSEKMRALFLDEQQQTKPFVMGCYGIGISRLVAAAVEQNHDEHGICWPLPIAPYAVCICTLTQQEHAMQVSEALYHDLQARGIEVLWDDRDERPGVKFKDADLLGIPLRVTVGGRSLESGRIECTWRASQAQQRIPLCEAAQHMHDALQGALSIFS